MCTRFIAKRINERGLIALYMLYDEKDEDSDDEAEWLQWKLKMASETSPDTGSHDAISPATVQSQPSVVRLSTALFPTAIPFQPSLLTVSSANSAVGKDITSIVQDAVSEKVGLPESSKCQSTTATFERRQSPCADRKSSQSFSPKPVPRSTVTQLQPFATPGSTNTSPSSVSIQAEPVPTSSASFTVSDDPWDAMPQRGLEASIWAPNNRIAVEAEHNRSSRRKPVTFSQTPPMSTSPSSSHASSAPVESVSGGDATRHSNAEATASSAPFFPEPMVQDPSDASTIRVADAIHAAFDTVLSSKPRRGLNESIWAPHNHAAREAEMKNARPSTASASSASSTSPSTRSTADPSDTLPQRGGIKASMWAPGNKKAVEAEMAQTRRGQARRKGRGGHSSVSGPAAADNVQSQTPQARRDQAPHRRGRGGQSRPANGQQSHGKCATV